MTQRNGVRQVSLAAQRLCLVPASNQGFFVVMNNNNNNNQNALIMSQMRYFSGNLPSH